MHESGHRLVEDLYRDTRTALAPGKGLDYQNLMMGKSLQRLIEELDLRMGDGGAGITVKGLNLYHLIHHLISIATTDGVYGKNNPFRNPDVEKNFWYVKPSLFVSLSFCVFRLCMLLTTAYQDMAARHQENDSENSADLFGTGGRRQGNCLQSVRTLLALRSFRRSRYHKSTKALVRP
jgi:hypothetical protein